MASPGSWTTRCGGSETSTAHESRLTRPPAATGTEEGLVVRARAGGTSDDETSIHATRFMWRPRLSLRDACHEPYTVGGYGRQSEERCTRRVRGRN